MISIHAPTNGATCCSTIHTIHIVTFQSTLRRTERRVLNKFSLSFINFNPRSDERSDCICLLLLNSHLDFNPRSDERSDYEIVTQTKDIPLFQSTLRRTERRYRARDGRSMLEFQSTLRRTERRNYWIFPDTNLDFNPRSDERSDPQDLNCSIFVFNFNPRSDERSDIPNPAIFGLLTNFNPRSDERSDVS